MTMTPRNDAAGAKGLTPVEIKLLARAAAAADIRSSDRPSDRARTKLKRLGYLVFDRDDWRWRITKAGRLALSTSPGDTK